MLSDRSQQAPPEPFQIVHNARPTRRTRSRKSSIHTIDRETPWPKFKRVRKMTLNPEVSHDEDEQIKREELQGDFKSERGIGDEKEDQQFNFDSLLDLGTHKIRSEMELEMGISSGIVSERELDSDFRLACHQEESIDR